MSVTRDRLASLLWSDRDDKHARSSLRQSLKLLRRELGTPGYSPLLVTDETISLDSDLLEVDALGLLKLTETADAISLQKATDRYRGDLLSGLTIPDSAFEEWLTGERRRLHDLAESALTRLLVLSIQAGQQDRAVSAAQRLLTLDPLSEFACCALMQIYSEHGQTPQALKVYVTFRDRLQNDLGVKPDPQTVELYESIRQQRMVTANLTQKFWSPGTLSNVPPPLPAKPSIAVMPFDDLGRDPTQVYFSDGITEDIITELSRFRSMNVIARNSSFAFRNERIDISEIARRLRVQFVLEGMRGGRRNGAGRPKGAKNRLSKILVQQANASGEKQPLDVLLEIMRDETADIRLRIRAAKSAAPYFHSRAAPLRRS
jgi:DNA-binding SARP family transcriptional activator